MHDTKQRVAARGNSWEVWNELKHLKGLFEETLKNTCHWPDPFPAMSKQTLPTAFSMCWVRPTNGAFENPVARSFQQTLATALLHRGPISNRSQAKLSNEVKSQTMNKLTSLHCKYIGKGQQFKRENEQNCDDFPWNEVPGGGCSLRCPQESCAGPRGKRAWVGRGQEAPKM